jgi:hypothetical protein
VFSPTQRESLEHNHQKCVASLVTLLMNHVIGQQPDLRHWLDSLELDRYIMIIYSPPGKARLCNRVTEMDGLDRQDIPVAANQHDDSAPSEARKRGSGEGPPRKSDDLLTGPSDLLPNVAQENNEWFSG